MTTLILRPRCISSPGDGGWCGADRSVPDGKHGTRNGRFQQAQLLFATQLAAFEPILVGLALSAGQRADYTAKPRRERAFARDVLSPRAPPISSRSIRLRASRLLRSAGHPCGLKEFSLDHGFRA